MATSSVYKPSISVFWVLYLSVFVAAPNKYGKFHGIISLAEIPTQSRTNGNPWAVIAVSVTVSAAPGPSHEGVTTLRATGVLARDIHDIYMAPAMVVNTPCWLPSILMFSATVSDPHAAWFYSLGGR